MKFLIMVAILCFLPLLGFWVGTQVSRPKQDKLKSDERLELERLRLMRNDLLDTSAQHIALGDPYAAIVFDTVRDPARGKS